MSGVGVSVSSTYYYYIVALFMFMWITSNRSLKIYSGIFGPAHRIRTVLFASEPEGEGMVHGPRTNKFIRVILRLIKKTFTKWRNIVCKSKNEN